MKKFLCLVLSLLMCFSQISVSFAYNCDLNSNDVMLSKDIDVTISKDKNSELNAVVNKIANNTKGLTTVEKIVYVHDYIVSSCLVDYEGMYDDTSTNKYTAYDCLVVGLATPEGFARAFDLVMEKLGIECVLNSVNNNESNYVKLDGSWYHVSVGYSKMASEHTSFNTVHEYLLLSDKVIKAGTLFPIAINKKYKCTSTKYDNAFWVDMSSPAYYHKGYWYFYDRNTSVDDDSGDFIYTYKFYKSKGLFGTRELFLDFTDYVNFPLNEMQHMIYDGSYFYLSCYIRDEDDSYYDGTSYIKRINPDNKNIDTVYKLDGSIANIIYRNDKYYIVHEFSGNVEEIVLNKVAEKAQFTAYSSSLTILRSTDYSTHEYLPTEFYNYAPSDLAYKIYTKDSKIAQVIDGKIYGLKKGKTKLFFEGENGIKHVFDINVVDTILEIYDYTEIVLVGNCIEIGYKYESSYDGSLTFSVNDKSIARFIDDGVLKALKPGVVTYTITAPDGTSVSQAVKVVNKTGWHEFNGFKYYMYESGILATRWNEIDGIAYFFDYDGRMHTGWYTDGYYDSSVGDYVTDIYYFDKNGRRVNGWQSIDNQICYFNVNTYVLEKKFEDVNGGKWYFNTVFDALKSGLMNGTSETTFSPDDNMTRGMIVSVLHRIAGTPKVTYTGRFSDVKKSSYCATAVEWAAKNKVVSGYSNGKFGPNDNITRQDVAVILYNYARTLGLNVKNNTDLNKFTDYKNVSSYAKEAMQWAVSVGILSGSTKDGKTYLNPKSNATRAECAKMLLVASKIYK